VIVHKVEEAAHFGTVTPGKGWCLLAVFAREVKRPSAPDRYSPLVGASPTGSKLSRATQPISGRGDGTRYARPPSSRSIRQLIARWSPGGR
jgi:hypothetical protein